MTLKLNNSEFNQKIWEKKSSNTQVEPMKMECVWMTAKANWTQLAKSTQAESVRDDPPLNECQILYLHKFFALFVLILYVTATLTFIYGS